MKNDINKFKNLLVGASANYKFFQFKSRPLDTFRAFKFPINRIRSHNQTKAKPFYKHISRCLTHEKFIK